MDIATQYNNWKKFNIWMSIEEYKEQVTLRTCFFCGFLNGAEVVNDLSLINSLSDLSIKNKNNFVVACSICNQSKGTLDPATFVERCRIVCGELSHKATVWPVIGCKITYSEYATRSINEGFGPIGITEADFELYQKDSCRYCSRHPVGGCKVMREDNDKGYTKDNVFSCCEECGYLREPIYHPYSTWYHEPLHHAYFIWHCKRVSEYCDLSQLPFQLKSDERSYVHYLRLDQ